MVLNNLIYYTRIIIFSLLLFNLLSFPGSYSFVTTAGTHANNQSQNKLINFLYTLIHYFLFSSLMGIYMVVVFISC